MSEGTPCVSKQCPADGVWRIGRGVSPDRVRKTRFTPSESSAGHGYPLRDHLNSVQRMVFRAYCKGLFPDAVCWTRLRNTWVPSFRFSFRGNMRTYPRSGLRSWGTSERTLVPVFVLGEHPPKPPFWKTTLLWTLECWENADHLKPPRNPYHPHRNNYKRKTYKKPRI